MKIEREWDITLSNVYGEWSWDDVMFLAKMLARRAGDSDSATQTVSTGLEASITIQIDRKIKSEPDAYTMKPLERYLPGGGLRCSQRYGDNKQCGGKLDHIGKAHGPGAFNTDGTYGPARRH